MNTWRTNVLLLIYSIVFLGCSDEKMNIRENAWDVTAQNTIAKYFSDSSGQKVMSENVTIKKIDSIIPSPFSLMNYAEKFLTLAHYGEQFDSLHNSYLSGLNNDGIKDSASLKEILKRAELLFPFIDSVNYQFEKKLIGYQVTGHVILPNTTSTEKVIFDVLVDTLFEKVISQKSNFISNDPDRINLREFRDLILDFKMTFFQRHLKYQSMVNLSKEK